MTHPRVNNDDAARIHVEMSSQGDAAEWTVGLLRWRITRVAARWELVRCWQGVEVREGRYRAMDDAIAYSLGWTRGLAASAHTLRGAAALIAGEDFVRATLDALASGKGVRDGS